MGGVLRWSPSPIGDPTRKENKLVTETQIKDFMRDIPLGLNRKDKNEEWYVALPKNKDKNIKPGLIVKVRVQKTRSFRFARLVKQVSEMNDQNGLVFTLWATEEVAV